MEVNLKSKVTLKMRRKLGLKPYSLPVKPSLKPKLRANIGIKRKLI